MDIEVRLLRSFVAIFEKGSLSRAAEKLACTQAAMSMRLKILETEIGEPLFRRQHHKLEPTFKGTEFYARALSVLASYDELISASRSQVSRQKIRIGVPDDYALAILPRALAKIAKDLAQIEIEIVCDLSAKLATALQRQEIDLALVTLAAKPSNALVSCDISLHWVFDPGFIDQPDQAVGIAAYPEGCVFRRAMILALEMAQIPWQIAAQSRSHAGIVSALRGQFAVTAMAAGMAPSGLLEMPKTDRLPLLCQVPIYLLNSGSTRSKAIMVLEAAFEAVLSSMGSSHLTVA